MTIVLDFVKQHVPPGWQQNSTGWVTGNCPVCIINGESRNDTKKRGGFQFDQEGFRYHCFNCGFATSWHPGDHIGYKMSTLLGQFGADTSDIQRLKIELMKEQDTAELLIKRPKPEEPKLVFNWPEIKLPANSCKINECDISQLKKPELFVKACEYIVERNLDNWDDWYYSDFSHMKHRIILPYRYQGKIVGFTARWIGNPPEGATKYYLQQPTDFVFNLDRQTKEREFVIVTEGQFDALAIDGVAIGTNSISDTQARIIEKLKKRVILLPDADAPGHKLAEQAIERGWAVSFPPWEGVKDAADAADKYGKLFTLKTIVDSAVSNQTKARVLAKKYCK